MTISQLLEDVQQPIFTQIGAQLVQHILKPINL